MKLKNKKTGEIATLTLSTNGEDMIIMGNDMHAHITKLSELKGYEDYEEPKEDGLDNIITLVEAYSDNDNERYPKEIVEKLKAWKRLKDKGFKFEGIDGLHYTIYYDEGKSYETHEQCEQAKLDLELLFGGNE
jgi:hypothetical protein